MKRLSATASAIALALAFAGQAWATESPEPLSEAQLDAVVAGTTNHGNYSAKDHGNDHGNRGRGHGYGHDKDHGKGYGHGHDRHGKSYDVAGGGIGGTGAIALRK